MEDDFVVVANTKGKADIWRHFGLKNRKHDGTIWIRLQFARHATAPSRLQVVLPI